MTKIIRTKTSKNFIPFIKEIRNKIGSDSGRFGLFMFGDYEFGDQNSIGKDYHGVYQMRHCKEGILAIKMRFQKTREEVPTAPRVANWTKFANAITAWQALTDEQKAVYNQRAKGTTKTGNNIFISEYMLS